jgi:hypothetical protein
MQEIIISSQLDEKPKSFWQYIKSKKTETSGVSHLRGKDGLLNLIHHWLTVVFVSIFVNSSDTNLLVKFLRSLMFVFFSISLF